MIKNTRYVLATLAVRSFPYYFLVTVNRLKGKYQVPVVQKVDSAIHWINHYAVDNAISLRNAIH